MHRAAWSGCQGLSRLKRASEKGKGRLGSHKGEPACLCVPVTKD